MFNFDVNLNVLYHIDFFRGYHIDYSCKLLQNFEIFFGLFFFLKLYDMSSNKYA